MQHYITTGKALPILMNYSQPTIGLSNMTVSGTNEWIVCSFTRQIKMSSQPYYYDLTKPNYVLAAYGPMDINTGLANFKLKINFYSI